MQEGPMPGSQVTRCAVGWESLAYSRMEAAGARARAVGVWGAVARMLRAFGGMVGGCRRRLGYGGLDGAGAWRHGGSDVAGAWGAVGRMPQAPGALGSRAAGAWVWWVENCAELGCIACNCVGNHACKGARCVANGG